MNYTIIRNRTPLITFIAYIYDLRRVVSILKSERSDEC